MSDTTPPNTGQEASIEKNATWRVLDQTLAEVRAQFADISAKDLQEIIDEAVQRTGLKRTRP